MGDKVECVWPGDSGYQFQITSVHRLAIGFPGGGAGITAQQEVNAAAALHEAEPVPIESDPIQEEQADLQSMFSDAACANVPDDEVCFPDGRLCGVCVTLV